MCCVCQIKSVISSPLTSTLILLSLSGIELPISDSGNNYVQWKFVLTKFAIELIPKDGYKDNIYYIYRVNNVLTESFTETVRNRQ